MNIQTIKGVSFGLTSAAITTLGLIIGLNSSTHSTMVVIGGIVTIAIADSFSDALGIHISEEAENQHTTREIWQATAAAFLSKFIFALSFIIPFLLFSLDTAVIISIVYGLSLIVIFSFYIARSQKVSAVRPVLEHLIIAILVIAVTHFVGVWVAAMGIGT